MLSEKNSIKILACIHSKYEWNIFIDLLRLTSWIEFWGDLPTPGIFNRQASWCDTCSLKGQLERTIKWKVRNEIGKIEVGKLKLWAVTLSNFSYNFRSLFKFSNLKKTFQLRSALSHFARFFSTFMGSFQLCSFFPTSLGSFQLKRKLFNLNFSNFSFFPTVISNYLYPKLID